MKKLLAIIPALCLLAAVNAGAKVTFPSVISDNMVLQQRTDVALWGTATPGKTVTLTTGWSNELFRTRADART